MRCLVYGMRGGAGREPERDGHLEFRAPSVEGFLEDLRTARGVVTGGGFSLLSEAVYLGKPVLAIPLRGQFEQLMNARYLERNRYGACAHEPTAEALTDVRRRGSRSSSEAVAGYEQERQRGRAGRRSRSGADAAGASEQRRELAADRRAARRIVREAGQGKAALLAGSALGFAYYHAQVPDLAALRARRSAATRRPGR